MSTKRSEILTGKSTTEMLILVAFSTCSTVTRAGKHSPSSLFAVLLRLGAFVVRGCGGPPYSISKRGRRWGREGSQLVYDKKLKERTEIGLRTVWCFCRWSEDAP